MKKKKEKRKKKKEKRKKKKEKRKKKEKKKIRKRNKKITIWQDLDANPSSWSTVYRKLWKAPVNSKYKDLCWLISRNSLRWRHCKEI